MTPEERFAQRWIAQRGLVPPIDVEALAGELADVEETDLPVEGDAILIHPVRKRRRPQIILARGKPTKRRRFTLAHEIGHLVIPWHVGTIACHTDHNFVLTTELYELTEGEANRFASELLLPTHWLKSVIESCPTMRAVMRESRAANISDTVICLKLIHVLRPGCVFAQVNNMDQVVYSGRSRGTFVEAPSKSISFDSDIYAETHAIHEVVRGSGLTTHWWRFDVDVELPKRTDSRTSTQVLRELLGSLGYHGQQAQNLFWSINGISGHANGVRRPPSENALFAVLLERFSKESQLADVIAHPTFQIYLAKRAGEMISKRKASN